MNQTPTPSKKSARLIGAIIFIGLVFLPIIPQIKPYEALTEEGGYYGQDYGVESVFTMIKDWDCNLNCFPQTDQTRRWNLTSFGLTTLVLLAVSFGVGQWTAKRFKS